MTRNPNTALCARCQTAVAHYRVTYDVDHWGAITGYDEAGAFDAEYCEACAQAVLREPSHSAGDLVWPPATVPI